MVDSEKLERLINEKGLKYRFIADKLGMSYYAFYKKLRNMNEFKASEISALCNLLEISSDSLSSIFFADECDLKSNSDASGEYLDG